VGCNGSPFALLGISPDAAGVAIDSLLLLLPLLAIHSEIKLGSRMFSSSSHESAAVP